jgi:hypothetical protein
LTRAFFLNARFVPAGVPRMLRSAPLSPRDALLIRGSEFGAGSAPQLKNAPPRPGRVRGNARKAPKRYTSISLM